MSVSGVCERLAKRDQSESVVVVRWAIGTEGCWERGSNARPTYNKPGQIHTHTHSQNLYHNSCMYVESMTTNIILAIVLLYTNYASPAVSPYIQAPTLSPLPTIRKTSPSPRRLSQKHSIFVSPHTRKHTHMHTML